MSQFPDLRNDHEESATFDNGTVYRKGLTVQVWWLRDTAGRPFDNTKDDLSNGRETWTFPDLEQAQRGFADFQNLDVDLMR